MPLVTLRPSPGRKPKSSMWYYFAIAFNILAWLFTLGLGLFLIWLGIACMRGRPPKLVKMREEIAPSLRRSYLRHAAGVCLVAGLWFAGLAILSYGSGISRGSWLAFFMIGNVILVWGSHLLDKKYGLTKS